MGRNIYEYDPLIGYRFIPKIKARIEFENGGYLVKTNNLGFRCEHDVTKKKPKNKFRVILFGNSNTAGVGVSNKYRYGDLLEIFFPKIEILNFGLPGTGIDQHYLVFKKFCKDLEYDLLLICPSIENIRRNVARYRITSSSKNKGIIYRPKPYFKIENNKLILYNNPVPTKILNDKHLKKNPELLKYVDKGGRFPKFTQFLNDVNPNIQKWIQKIIRYQPFPEYNKKNNYAWILMQKIIQEWINKVINVIICPIPTYHYIEKMSNPKKYKKRFLELENELNVKFIDLLPQFLMKSKKTRLECRFKFDPHPTPLGHKIIADGLKPIIERYYQKWIKNI